MLGSSSILSPLLDNATPDDLIPYNMDWTRKWKGNSQIVLMPSSISQIQQILRYCSSNRLPVVPQGGNTGLVGGGIPMNDEIVLSMKKLNNIISFDQNSGVLVCEAGCILHVL